MKPEENNNVASCLAGSFRCQIEVSASFPCEGLVSETILSPAVYFGRCSSQAFDVVMLCGSRVTICA